VEFSPNGSFLYLSQFGSESKVSQFSLLAVTKEEIEDSEIILYSSSKAIGALLLAPDFKIYVSKFNSRYLDLIENPDVEGLNCNYQEDALYLNGRKSSIGLPNFNNAYLLSPDLILYENYCLGEETRIYVESTKTIDSIHYTVFDGANRIMSNAMEIIHIFSDIGEFMVEAEIFFEGKSKVLKSTVLILDAPVLSFALDTTICESRTVQYFIQQAFTEVIWNGTSTGSAYSIREEGNYFIELKNACGEMRESFEVEQTECLCDFYVPSAFSPNADGLNESFKPVHSCALSQYELLIYNRWGELLFTTQASHVGWNGMYEVVLLPSALYIYVIYYTSRGAATKQLSGMVYLYH
jgi:gliding motility-associated-like protein